MQKHVRNYLEYFGYDVFTRILCELCGTVAVDIHHVEPRSKFGTKTKHIQDHITNLIALCRDCHIKAHSTNMKDELKQIIERR